MLSNGADYRGNKSATENGDICKSWASIPLSSAFPDAGGLGDHNYCRNPWPELGYHDRPWCYVSDNEWEDCDVNGYPIHPHPWWCEGTSGISETVTVTNSIHV